MTYPTTPIPASATRPMHDTFLSPLLRHVKGCVLALLLICGAGAAMADPARTMADPVTAPSTVKAGIAAAEAGRLAEAIKILTPHAEQGDAVANHTLGLIYMRRTGDDAMTALSHQHFKRAAKSGHVGAVFEVAFQFERGIGTEPDLKRAIKLYQLAAHSNHLNAQYNLAILLSNGNGVEPDLQQAYFWATAAQNNAVRAPNRVLTESRISSLARTIRARLPYQKAAQASTAAARLTGQPV